MFRVLLVEDNNDQAEVIRAILARGEPPFAVDIAGSAGQCEQALAKNAYDAVLLDYDLPGMNGLELLQKLRAQEFSSPVLLVTGRGSEHVAAKAGAADYVMIDSAHLQVWPRLIHAAIQKKQLERQIRASKMRLQAVFDSIPDMISVQDKDFNIVLVNRKFGEWASSRPERLIGQKCYQRYFQREAPCLGCPVEKTLSSRGSDFLEMVYGGEILQVSSYPMFNESGDLEYVIEYARVVTEQKRFEKQLIQAEKLATIGLLSSGVAHELRNPLNTIDTARYFLAELPQLQEPEIKEKLGIIQKNVRRAANIINNLLEFSRYSDRERESVDVNKLLDSTLALIGKELSAKNIKVVKRYQDVPTVFFNLDGLKQVFLNLIVNAAQAMPASGSLTISTAPAADDCIQVEIADTGAGISKENMQHIFSPFFTTKAVGEGTGLGLYISHTLIERDGGKITVESEPGKGTTFCVHLPVEGRTGVGGGPGYIAPELRAVGN